MTIKTSRHSQRGYTLVELMVSMAIGLVILAALGVVYIGTTRTTKQAGIVSHMSEDAAVAFKYIGGYLRMAGYSMPAVLTVPGGALVGGVIAQAPDRAFSGAGVRGCDHGFDALSAAFDSTACATSGTGPAAISVRFEGDKFNTIPITTTVPGSASLTLPSDCLNQQVAATAVSALGGTFSLVDSRFLGQNHGTSGNPELYCAGNGNGFASPQPLLESVEDIRISYGVAASTISRDVAFYTNQQGVDALAGSVNDRWLRVVTVKVCLLMRSESRNQANNGDYIDCDGSFKSSADGLMRRAFTSVYGLRNRSSFLTPP